MIYINFSVFNIKFDLKSIFNLNFIYNRAQSARIGLECEEREIMKSRLIRPLASFYCHPNFEVNQIITNEILLESFYKVAIKLTNDFEMSKSQFDYYKKNFGAHYVDNRIELTCYLTNQSLYEQRSDARYYLGFRSVYFILYNNLEKINYNYCLEINKLLKPFFDSYKCKDLLVSRLALDAV